MLQLKQQCRSLEGELESVETEIIKILREKEGTLEENGILDEYKKLQNVILACPVLLTFSFKIVGCDITLILPSF